jgi:hypothetical protein
VVRTIVACLIFLRAFFPPYLPSTGLRGSWQAGITEASMHGLVFGRDIIFTYGPLGYLTEGVAMPHAYYPMLAFSVLLSLTLALIVTYGATERGTTAGGIGYVLVVLICLAEAIHIDVVSICLIVAITLPAFRAEKVAAIPALVLGLASGLALVMKFNVGVAAIASGIVLLVLHSVRLPGIQRSGGNWRALALFCLGTAVSASAISASSDYGSIASLGLSAAAVGFALIAAISARGRAQIASAVVGAICCLVLLAAPTFGSFLGLSLQVSGGYSSGMALQGSNWELGFALALYVLVSLALFANRQALTIPVVGALVVDVFFEFKEGFIRQDAHVLYAFWIALLMSGIVLRVSARRRLLFINVIVACLALFGLSVVSRAETVPDISVAALKPASFVRDILRFAAAWKAPESASAVSAGLEPDRLPSSVVSAIGSSSVDVQPWETALVFSNGFIWNPEPVFQSYSAYTPALDRIDALHVRTAGAARTIFHWDSIDGRYPLWDQPAAMREILCSYALDPGVPGVVTTQGGDAVLVAMRVPGRCGTPERVRVETYAWDEPIVVPRSSDLVFLHLDINYSVVGDVLTLLFRAPDVRLRVSDARGRLVEYRVVPDNARNGVLIGPLPNDVKQLRLVLARKAVWRPSSVEVTTDAPFFFRKPINGALEIVPFQ